MQFLNCLQNKFFNQHVTHPTRYKEVCKVKIYLDLIIIIITNGDFVQDIKFQDPIGNSDHMVIMFNCLLEKERRLDSSRTKFNHNKGDYNKLREYFANNINRI